MFTFHAVLWFKLVELDEKARDAAHPDYIQHSTTNYKPEYKTRLVSLPKNVTLYYEI